ncbi:FIST signal transduction protein [Methanoplanus endosymbiosus]|uniref:FIST C-terminal domain-containing protein n=1 Tax=Methanoplanus endosymbiosus TaxID=33865 RepID=A0A9E7PL46_9EURY|nr:FIST N-terminal domain-containing protein [Methanoplanus endosymbiosus]UUX91915.1 FIST C-terminal domain-containing protein [Methanoplanus endosymbiosus]
MKTSTAYSEKPDINDAAEEIRGIFSGINPKMVIFFSSSAYPAEETARAMKEKFPDASVIGCTTSGEIISGKMLRNSIVAMAFPEGMISDIALEIVKNPGDTQNTEKAFESFARHFKKPMSELEFEDYVGIILADGLSNSEEKVMDKIGDLTNITFIGGSAGDDLKFEKTYLFADKEAYTDAVLLAVIKPANGFEIIKTQSFTALDKKMTATKVDEENRTVIEFNGKPAAEEYAAQLGTDAEKLPEYFMKHPLGVITDDDIFVRSPQQIAGSAVKFYCNIIEGMELNILESDDIVQSTKEDVNARLSELKEISGLINFHCILRTLELESKNQTEEYARIFEGIPAIGFSTYGEEYIGHINQTSTMLVFK